MGKKSSQKKQKKVAETQKKISTESNPTKLSEISVGSRLVKISKKTLVLALVIASLIALGFFAIFIWGELTKPMSIAKFIPQDAIGFVEFDANMTGQNWQNYNNLTEGKSFPTITSLINTVNTTLHIDMMKDVYPWLSRRAGISVLQDKKGAIFLEVKNEKQALDFFRQHRLASITEDLLEADIEGVKTYHYIASSPIALTFLGNYLVIASDDTAIKQIIDATKKSALFSNSNFQRIHNAVPQKNRLGFMFARPGQLTQMMPMLPEVLREVLAQNFIAEVASIKALDRVFAIEYVTLFSKQNKGKSLKSREKYKGKLITGLSDKTQFFMGGENAAFMSDKIEAMLSSTSSHVFASYLDETLKGIFDGDVSMEDAKKLLGGEYAFAMDDGQMKMMVRLSDTVEQEKILKKIIKGVESSRVFFPLTVENETIKGSAKMMKVSNTEYKNVKIQGSELEDGSKGIYLAMSDDVAIMTLSLDAMHRTIDTINGSLPSLKATQSYEDYIEPQMESGDDIMYARPHDLEKMLPDIMKFMRNVREISLSTNSFEDGMKAIIFFAP